jgi:hypothetical protein
MALRFSDSNDMAAVAISDQKFKKIYHGDDLIWESADIPIDHQGWDITSIDDLVMFRDLINTGTCIWNGLPTNTYKGNTVLNGGAGSTWYITNNIDMSSVCSSTIGTWIPIGISTRPFRGTIEGLNKTISNLYIYFNPSSSSSNYNALFGYVEGVTLKDFNLYVDNTGQNNTASLIGYMRGHTTYTTNTISNISTYGSIYSVYSAGGIISYAQSSITSTNSFLIIDNCHNYVTFSNTSGGSVAGVIHTISSANQKIEIYNCSNSSNFICSSAAGFCNSISTNNLIIDGIINNGYFETTSATAGIIISLNAAQGYITNITNNGNITKISGTAGSLTGCITTCNIGNISNLYNYGNILSNDGYVSGVIGLNGITNTTVILNTLKNYGSITNTIISTSLNNRVAGICQSIPNCNILNCENHGDINIPDATSIVSGIVILTGTYVVNIDNCINNGNITSKGRVVGIVDIYSKTSGTVAISNCINKKSLISTSTSTNSVTYHVAGISSILPSNSSYINCSNIDCNITGMHIAGIAYNSNVATYTNCVNNAIASSTYAPGVLFFGISRGPTNTVYTYCENYSSFSATNIAIGIGHNGSASFCKNYGNLTGSAAVGIILQGLGNIENCENHGNITSTSLGASGICRQGTVNIINCINYGNISKINNNDSSLASGISSHVTTTANCINHGIITANNGYGIGSSPTNCINYGDMFSVGNINHIYVMSGIGHNATNCINYGNISGVGYVTGIGGNVLRCINYGNISGSHASGILNAYFPNSASYCINLGNVSGSFAAGGITVQSSTGNGNSIYCINAGTVTCGTPDNGACIIGGTTYNTGILNSYYDSTLEPVYKGVRLFRDLYTGVPPNTVQRTFGLPTSSLKGTSLLGNEGFTTDNWVFEEGEYPLPKMS